MNMGEKLVFLRNRKGWSTAQLAQVSGVSRAYLWQLESGGKDRPSLDVLERLAKALGVSVVEFSQDNEAQAQAGQNPLPPSLAQFVRECSRKYGITKSDVEMLKNIHYRGRQPAASTDWELLYLFLRKWSGAE